MSHPEFNDCMGLQKKILLLVLIGLFVFSPAYGVPESSGITDNPTIESGIPNPIWSDLIGTEKVIVSVSDDGRYFIAGSDSGMFRMYDNTGKILWTYRNSSKSVSSISITSSGEYAVASFYQPYDQEIVFISRNGTKIWARQQGSDLPDNVVTSKDGEITTVSDGSTLIRVDKSGATISTITMQEDICRLAVSNSGHIIASAQNNHCPWRGLSGSLAVTDMNGTPFFNYPFTLSIIGIGISDNGTMISGIDESRVYGFNKEGLMMWNYSSSPQFRSVAISSDGQYTITGSQHFARFFNNTGSLLWKYYNEDGWANAVAISGNGDFILIGFSEKLLLFDRNGTQLWQYRAPSAIVSVSASKDGKYFAASTKNRVFFFNRWGNSTIIDSTDVDLRYGVSLPGITTNTSSPPTTAAALPGVVTIGALGICCFIGAISHKVRTTDR